MERTIPNIGVRLCFLESRKLVGLLDFSSAEILLLWKWNSFLLFVYDSLGAYMSDFFDAQNASTTELA